MTIRTNFVQSGTYSAADIVEEFRALFTDGIAKVSDGVLAVTALATPNLSVNVAPGSAIKSGLFLNNSAIVNVIITANISGYNRYDVIVADMDNNVITSVLGTPSSSPTVPILTGNKVDLATVLVGNNASVINTANITDTRDQVYAGSNIPNKRFVGTFSRTVNLVGNQTITIGFAPKFIKLMAAHSADRTFRSNGSCDGVSQIVLGEFSAPNNVPFVIIDNTVALHNGVSSFFGSVTLSTTNGFTIAWSNSGAAITAGNAIIKVEAWG